MTTSIGNKKIFKAGDTVMRQGDEGDCAYIIEAGVVEILIEKDRGLVQSIGTRGAGSIIGEMAIVDKKPRTATIKATEDCVLLEITHKEFHNRLEKSDPVVSTVAQVILTRYRDMITRAHILGKNDTLEQLEKEFVDKTDTIETLQIANEFKEVIDRDELELHYQPIIDLKTNKISGFEALMRWTHPERGAISPNVFIPIAEESDLIVKASKWALKRACQTLKRINDETGQDLFMSINFSSADFSEDDFFNHTSNILENEGIRPDQIHLEITERLLMDQPENAKQTLLQCREAGMDISIDDFGTGYSSLSYLHYFPINILKIDQSFIQNMATDETVLELVRSIIMLAKNMKMDIIAEGIETPEEAVILKEMDCDKAQGYHFARPMPETDVIELIKKQ